MSEVSISYNPAIQTIERADYDKMMRILEACGPDTAVRQIRGIYHDLIQNLGTFGSCAVATALFVAYRNQKGEHWVPMLVEDPEFPADCPLRTHWVAKNLDDDEAPAIDVTVADQEKVMLALGSEIEKKEVLEQLAQPDFLKRLQAGLDRFVDMDGKPYLHNMTAEKLASIYQNLCTQAVRPSRHLRVAPFAVLVKQ